MPTPYTDVYDFFLSKISDYSFIKLSQEELESDLEKYLRSSIVKFKQSDIDLQDRNHDLKQFNETVADDEIEILSSLMLVEYLNPKIISTQTLAQMLPDKEYKVYSQANHLDQMIKLRSSLRLEANQLISEYTFKNGLVDLQ